MHKRICVKSLRIMCNVKPLHFTQCCSFWIKLNHSCRPAQSALLLTLIYTRSCGHTFFLAPAPKAVALQGLHAMSADMEALHAALLNDRLPQQWARLGFTSLLPLTEWLKDVQARVAFFHSWLRRGQPAAFWLAAFYFPQVALTTAP